jgi:succinate dehydrogenase/fumarate reductase flavoprotein subunit
VSPARVGAAIARVTAPLGRPRGPDLYALQRSLRDLMWDKVGLVREGAGVGEALGILRRIGDDLDAVGVTGGPAFNVAWHDWLNLANQVTTATLIATSAMERRESRGAHYRRDHPTVEAGVPYVIRVQRDGDHPRVSREPVALTHMTMDGALTPLVASLAYEASD